MSMKDLETPVFTVPVDLEVETAEGEREKRPYKIRYHFTDEDVEKLEELRAKNQATLANQLALFVVEMRNGDGTKSKPKAEDFKKFHRRHQQQIIDAIMGDVYPNETASKT